MIEIRMTEQERLDEKEKIFWLLDDLRNRKSIIKEYKYRQKQEHDGDPEAFMEVIATHTKYHDKILNELLQKLNRIKKQFTSKYSCSWHKPHRNFSDAIDDLKNSEVEDSINEIINKLHLNFPE